MNEMTDQSNRESRIRLFSKKSKLGEWCISADPETFDISQVTYGFPYHLTNSRFPAFDSITTEDVYEHVRAVAEHRTGLVEWDRSREKVSDYILDWKKEFDDLLRMRIIGAYLTRRPESSIHQMDDYVHFKHSWLMDRLKLKDLIRQLIMTGQIDKLPSMDMAPLEFSSLQRLAKVWLDQDA